MYVYGAIRRKMILVLKNYYYCFHCIIPSLFVNKHKKVSIALSSRGGRNIRKSLTTAAWLQTTWKTVTCAIASVECPSELIFFSAECYQFCFTFVLLTVKQKCLCKWKLSSKKLCDLHGTARAESSERKVNLISVLSELATLLINKQVFHLIRIDRKYTRAEIDASLVRFIHDFLSSSTAYSESQEIGDEISALSLMSCERWKIFSMNFCVHVANLLIFYVRGKLHCITEHYFQL